MLKEAAHEPFLDRLVVAVDQAPPGDPATVSLVRARIDDLRKAITVWSSLDPIVAEARLFPLATYMADVYAAALLLEQAGWEHREFGTDRKALVARLYAYAHLADHDPLRGIDRSAEDLDRFDDLVEGALIL